MAALRILMGLLLVAKLCSSQCDGVKNYNARESGEISSPTYEAGKYSGNLKCLYRITAPKGYRIKLTFLDLDISPSISCVSDSLEILSGNNTIGIFCGQQTPRPLLSQEEDNEMQLVFVTAASSKGGRGFKIRYESALNLDMCASNQGECKNRNCYDVKKTCDGVDDCGDGTDEEECDYTPTYVHCGFPSIRPKTILSAPDRMIGGEIAVANSWPWHVSIQKRIIEPNGHFCSGTLIGAQWVLSAARCFKNVPNAKDIRVTLGSHKLFGKTKYEQVRMAERIIGYPDLEGDEIGQFSSEDDVVLIKLNAPVIFNDGVRPACLPSGHWYTQPWWTCYATGWGEMSGAGFSDELKQSIYVIKDRNECSYNKTTEICADFKGSAPCQGDTGGPLVCMFVNSWYVLGTSSKTAKTNPLTGVCTFSESKVIFTRVAHRTDWIRVTASKYSKG